MKQTIDVWLNQFIFKKFHPLFKFSHPTQIFSTENAVFWHGEEALAPMIKVDFQSKKLRCSRKIWENGELFEEIY